jgi:hypothetical protein
MNHVGLKIIEEDAPSLFPGYKRHVATWRSHDTNNPKLPLKHVCIGPLFKESDPESKTNALIQFSDQLGQKLRDYPPIP